MVNFRTLYITPVVITYKSSSLVELNGIVGDTIRRCLETTFKRIDNILLKHNPDAIPFFRSKIPDEIIKQFPDLKDFSTPPRGYSLAINTDRHNPFLLRIKINLFGRYAKILPLLFPLIPTIMDSWFKGKMQFIDLADANDNSISLSNQLPIKSPLEISFPFLQNTKLNGDRILLHFISPTMLNSRHNKFGDMHFSELIKAIHRRADIINRLYCNGEMAPSIDFNLTNQFVDVEKINLEWIYTPSKNKDNPITGYVGYVQYKSPLLSQYLALLLIGQWLQLGKKTNYGAGQYVIDNECYIFI